MAAVYYTDHDLAANGFSVKDLAKAKRKAGFNHKTMLRRRLNGRVRYCYDDAQLDTLLEAAGYYKVKMVKAGGFGWARRVFVPSGQKAEAA